MTWGIVAAAFMFIQGPISFYILRFLLGVMEAGFFPGVILFLTYWVPARHLSQARGYFYMGIAIAAFSATRCPAVCWSSTASSDCAASSGCSWSRA